MMISRGFGGGPIIGRGYGLYDILKKLLKICTFTKKNKSIPVVFMKESQTLAFSREGAPMTCFERVERQSSFGLDARQTVFLEAKPCNG